MTERLLIVGGSVRAAAMSARRAGFEPLAVDRFADADLRGVCSEFRRYDRLRLLPQLARRMPPADWLYSGPLENHPGLIDRIGKLRNLLGNNGATLHQLRDPACLAAALAQADLRYPPWCAADKVPAGRDWLRKPLRSAGGFGISRAGISRSGNGSTYFQKFIDGGSIGATFLGAERRAALVGVTVQLLGPAWGGSHEFQYVGSVGPLVLSTAQTQALTRIGDCIAEQFSVRGLFGIDAIVNEAGVWPLEVNPRYTASMEVLERALDIATMRWHVDACREGELPTVTHGEVPNHGCGQHGKAIVYANRAVVVDERLERALLTRNDGVADPRIADIPVAGTSIARGEPIVTVFAQGGTTADVEQGLRSAMAEVRRLAGDG